jgi:predicted transposase/invertase (TIGR01784 family)
MERGIKEGENQRNIAIAKSMLKDKMSIDIISKYTELSEKEIENIMNTCNTNNS